MRQGSIAGVLLRTATLLAALLAAGCMSWKPGWTVATPAPAAGDSGAWLAEADRLALEADTRAEVEELAARYDRILQIDPDCRPARRWSANYRILLGAAYAESRTEKRRLYREAIQGCERAMARNPEFRRRVEAGETAWEAADSLTAAEADALGDWATAVFYSFKEGRGVSRLLHFRWIRRAQTMMQQLDAVAPGWSGGGNDFSWGIIYLSLPAAAGGDRAGSEERLARGLAAGPNWMLHRWGRAKYYAVKYGERDLFVSDLEWVLAQDPRAMDSPYPWNVYFQRDARRMLADVDRIF